jgi:nickel-type superoxide dismutase maturation protease
VRADPIPIAVSATAVLLSVAMMRLARIMRLRVAGDSMRPLLRPGDRLVVRPAWRWYLRTGDLVVVRDPRQPQRRMIKRVVWRNGARAWVRGDNAEASTDSRGFGWVRLPPVVARPARRYAPADRAGRLAGA